MKASKKDKSIQTIPKGAWEAGLIGEHTGVSKTTHLNEITTDSQGNGYPITTPQHQKEDE